MILDKYFKRPIFWDNFLAISISFASYALVKKCFLNTPSVIDSISLASDATNISLTISGFILTLLTILITFKSGSKIKKFKIDDDENLFDLFFATGLYHETVRHLKNCIKSLIYIAFIGFSLKLFTPVNHKSLIFYFNISGLTIIIMTMWRCLLILSKVMEMQNEKDNNF
jgi:hypothetical protein